MSDLAQTIGLLRGAFPRQDFPEVSVVIYARALQDLDPVAVRRAVDALIAREDWLPSIAKIRREAGEQTLDLPTVTEAWVQIQTPIGRAGAPPPVKAALESVGGPWSLRVSPTGDIERRFRKAYGDIREAALRDFAETRPPSMIGTQTRELAPGAARAVFGDTGAEPTDHGSVAGATSSGAESPVAGDPHGGGALGETTAGASAPDEDSAPTDSDGAAAVPVGAE